MSEARQQNPLSPMGLIITKRRLELNISHRMLAKKVGTSEVYLSFILHGVRPGDKYMDKILSELGIQNTNLESTK